MLSLRHLSYFIAAAETGGFVHAGRALNVSANSIVHAVNSLEEQLHCQLFVRKASHGLTITEDGQELLLQAQELLSISVSIEENFSKQDTMMGELVLGCLDSLAWSLAPLLIEFMGRIHPNLSIRLKILTTTAIAENTSLDEYDVILTFNDGFLIDRFDEDVFLEVLPFVMMAGDHPLSNNESLQIEQIEPYPLIILDTGPRESYFLDMFQKRDKSPKIGLRTSSSIVSWSLVSVTQMVAIRHLKPLISTSPVGKEVLCRPLKGDLPTLNISTLSNQTAGRRKKDRIKAFKDAASIFFNEGQFDKYVIKKTP